MIPMIDWNSIPFLAEQCYDGDWGGFEIAIPFIRWNIEVVFGLLWR